MLNEFRETFNRMKSRLENVDTSANRTHHGWGDSIFMQMNTNIAVSQP